MTATAGQPARAEVVALACLLILGCISAAHAAGGFWNLAANFRDNPDYARIAEAIRTGRLRDVGHVKHFWGVSYAAAAASKIAGISGTEALVFVTLLGSLAAVLLARELWGGWAALFFLGADWAWLECSSYGAGAHTLFAALLFGALLAARKERWPLAAGLTAFATTVRPLGVFALPPVVVAAYRHRGRQAAARAAALAAAIFVLYCVPLAWVFHDPFANYHGYQRQVWQGGLPVTIPFKAILEDFGNRASAAKGIASYLKLAYVLGHGAALGLLGLVPGARRRALERPVETTFVALYSAFILTYNSPHWALAIHAYLLLPLVPYFLWAFDGWLPKRRSLAYGLGLISMALACLGGLGVRTCHQLLLRYFG